MLRFNLIHRGLHGSVIYWSKIDNKLEAMILTSVVCDVNM